MTEEEWQACEEIRPLLRAIDLAPSERKLRLFVCACCRRIWSLLVEEVHRQAVELGEQFADRPIAKKKHDDAFRAAQWKTVNGSVASASCLREPFTVSEALDGAYAASSSSTIPFPTSERRERLAQEQQKQAALLRDILGNPFRPVAFSPSWYTDTAVALAQHMYDSRDFSAMPILADALQDAGCDNGDLLAHCRDPHAKHVRGCWVVDLVLGKK